jgi:putative addiction module killer protein
MLRLRRRLQPRWFELNRVISNSQSVGAGVFEYRIDFGPGYRIYFGKDGETVVILLGGGTKKHQSDNILAAQNRWQDFKARKVKET